MKKLLLTLSAIVLSISAQAYDYPYLAFQTTSGTTTTVEVESLEITIESGQITVKNSDDTVSFNLTELSKMYFSTTDVSGEATGIHEMESLSSTTENEIYDLQGNKVSQNNMRPGVYIIKMNNGTRKVNLK